MFYLKNHNQLKKAYRLEPLLLKHYATKSPLEIQKATEPYTKYSYKEMNEKRSALDIDLKSTLSKNQSNRILLNKLIMNA
jgi:hypothetical protein